MSWNVLITARTFEVVGKIAVEILEREGCKVTLPPKLGPFGEQELLDHIEGMDAVLCSPDQYTATVLNHPRTQSLKMISRWGVGFDSIDVPAATRSGIVVAYTPGMLNEAVADYTFALLLTLARRTHEAHAVMADGGWRVTWGSDVGGKTMGIIGCGRIGLAVARRAAGFGMKILGHDVFQSPEALKLGIQFVTLEQLLMESDIVTLHAALTEENKGMIGESELAKMKPSAFLINTARGAHIQDAALIKALQENRIAGAALDAFTEEPIPGDHPFRKLPNVLLSPHQAPTARDTGERVSHAAAQAILDLMKGQRPQMLVNPEVFDSAALRAKLS